MKTVFYSWQSDISSKTNRNVIEKAITSAIKKHNASLKEEEVQFILDKDTLNEPGSPDIVETIINKIDECELFVADITPILTSESGKAMPNSNVLFEAGYSVGKKGFKRTIFVVNEAYSSVETLPFDLKTKRILKYKLSEADLGDSDNKNNVVKNLSSAISTSLKLIGELPEIELPPIEDPTEAIKRERDLTKLKRFLEKMPPKVIQDHVHHGFESMLMDFNTFTALYNMQSIQTFIGFRLYDPQLSERIDVLMTSFDKSLSFGYNFYHLRNNLYRFESSEEVSEKDYIGVLDNLNKALDSLLDYIHNEYVEIDLEEYGNRAWSSYIEEIKDDEE
ncbi:TIR domain-containing protein [Vibrio parahaemolyticus]